MPGSSSEQTAMEPWSKLRVPERKKWRRRRVEKGPERDCMALMLIPQLLQIQKKRQPIRLAHVQKTDHVKG